MGKLAKTAKVVEEPNLPIVVKVSKEGKMVQYGPKWLKRSRIAKIAPNGQKWPELA